MSNTRNAFKKYELAELTREQRQILLSIHQKRRPVIEPFAPERKREKVFNAIAVILGFFGTLAICAYLLR